MAEIGVFYATTSDMQYHFGLGIEDWGLKSLVEDLPAILPF